MSSLSDDELKRLASELDMEFLEELRDLLRSVPLRSGSYDEVPDETVSYGETSLAEAIYYRSKARRLTKDRVSAYMREIDPHTSKALERSALPLRDLIREFVVLSAPESAGRLLGLVAGQLEQDPYLTGITTRR